MIIYILNSKGERGYAIVLRKFFCLGSNNVAYVLCNDRACETQKK